MGKEWGWNLGQPTAQSLPSLLLCVASYNEGRRRAAHGRRGKGNREMETGWGQERNSGTHEECPRDQQRGSGSMPNVESRWRVVVTSAEPSQFQEVQSQALLLFSWVAVVILKPEVYVLRFPVDRWDRCPLPSNPDRA